jgi:hypothetical protein
MKLKRWVYVIAIGIAVFQAVPVKAATDISNCPSGEIVGQPPMAQVPTYDYDAVGILQFHFHFTSESWNYNTLKVGYYDQGCVFVSEQNTGQVGGVALPPAKNLLVKVETSVPGKYNFKVYNEDTGEFQGGGLGFVPNDFNQWGISITLSNVTGSYYQPTVDVVTTPAVPLQKPVQVPAKNPVLVVPGVMGTELLKDSALLWPNINRMLTDVGDHFLDDLALDQEFQPQTGISVGDLVKEPFPGEHYYDNLLSGLERMGYKENQNLFVFPYDWRFGVSEQTATALAERIKGIAGNFKIDVIAHSTGGLLLKKALQQTQGSFIDKAILIAVPNYGSSQAGKILTGGDDLGIPWLDPLEIKKLSQNFPVIYDLLPGAVLSEEPSENSNAKAWQNARDLHTHEFDNYDWSSRGVNSFVIAGCGSDTNGQTGDGTVEITSAVGNSTPDKTFYVMGSNHSKLPGAESSLEVIGDILDNQQTQNFTNPNITQELSKSGQIFSEKNSYEKLPIASLTKLMTGYVAYKNLNFKETAEVYPRTFWQVSPKLNLTFKDRILVQDLFDSMIIGSANDSAFALAQFYENSTQKNFIEEMNKTAAELGMLDTSFSNPAGFDSMQNFSTVSDLKILITKVFSLPAFKNLARKTSIEFTSLSGNSYKIKATNKLLNKYQDILAIKTGYTKESLGSMATVIDSGLGEIALIVLHSPEREKDTLNLREAVLNSTLKTEIRNLDF